MGVAQVTWKHICEEKTAGSARYPLFLVGSRPLSERPGAEMVSAWAQDILLSRIYLGDGWHLSFSGILGKKANRGTIVSVTRPKNHRAESMP